MAEPLLLNIDDKDIEDPSYFESIKAEHFADGVPVVYAATDEPDNELYIIEHPDGRKVYVHESKLGQE